MITWQDQHEEIARIEIPPVFPFPTWEDIRPRIETAMDAAGVTHDDVYVFANMSIYVRAALDELGAQGHIVKRVRMIYPPATTENEQRARIAETPYAGRHGCAGGWENGPDNIHNVDSITVVKR